MNISVNDRIKKLREVISKGSNLEFSKFMDEKPNTISSWINSGRRIGIDVVDKLKSRIPSLNINWLLTGEGDMFGNGINEVVPISSSKFIEIPLVSQYAHAGYLCGFSDLDYISTLPTIPTMVTHEPRGNYIAFEVKGDSMYDGTDDSLNEGDILICRNIDKNYWTSKLHNKD